MTLTDKSINKLFSLTEGCVVKLKVLAEKRGTSMSALVRELIDEEFVRATEERDIDV